jgi:multiple sugar transport system permease protein
MRSSANDRPVSNGLIEWGILIVLAILNLIPFVWGALTSLKPARELMLYPPRLFGSEIDWSHYITVLSGSFTRAALNSVLYCALSVAAGLLFANLCAYGMTRYIFPGKKFMFYMILAGIPLATGSAAMVVPNYMMFSSLKMVDMWYTLPIVYIAYNLPMAAWITIGGMHTVPYAIEEAAQIDGASRQYIIFSLLPRLTLPSLACAALMIFIGAWNEFAISSMLVNSTARYPIQVSIYNFIGYFGREWGPLTAAATLAVIPVLIVFTFLGKLLISGLTAGAVKE